MSLEGRLEDLGLPDIFQIISLSKRSGVLTIVRKEGTGRLVFSQGQLVFGSSDSKSRLGYNLIKKGIITTEELEKALRVQKAQQHRVPLGTLLKNMGAISAELLEQEIKEHLIEVVKDILTWDRGYFHFELGAVVQNEVFYCAGSPADFLILEASRRNDEDGRDRLSSEEPSPVVAKAAALASAPSTEAAVAVSPIPVKTGQSAGPASKAPSPPDAVSGNAEDSFAPTRSSRQEEERKGERAAPPPYASRKDLSLLNPMIEELSSPSSSSEITLLVLRYASELMGRAVIFLVRKEDIIGLGQFGLDITSPDERIRGVRIPLTEPSVFLDVVTRRSSFKGPLPNGEVHQQFLDQIGGQTPLEAFVAPVISEGRVIALLYGDNLPAQETIVETEGLEAFIKVAGFAFEKAILERKLFDKGH